ncbi:phage tail tape measure protein [Pseudarthrobacter sp. NPDC055928]|uniref:phage tail tape measure protein n=1 Tax=Pseudarthrobacter sp. NPDC055928 TaxID=3345661 RepID=UPI0035DA7DCC
MADRRVKVIFSAEIAGFKSAMEQAAQATKKTQQASEDSSKAADTYLGKMVQSANKNREAWDTAGTTMLGFGAAAVGGLALAGKAAMDWESAWAGVTKTVDGTPAQMDELEGSLRNLAKTLPSTHEEIAAVAEAAGQLGVKREDVVGFTKTMVDLGETTNLSADEAATSIAQISNVMGTMEREGSKGVERFGATLVALGNAGASTEAEILEMAKRIAGAAKLVGASESDVLALSNAMASLGIEAQLGGGVISRVMQRMYGDVKAGGEGLDRLAEVAGVSAKEFATAFETDPVRAVDMMVKGFGRIKDEGGNVIDTMSDLGIKGTEETGVILRLAGAGDILTDSLKLGDSAWQSNSALAEEAAKRYETTESKVKVAWNNIKDAAIEAGAVLLPLIAGVAESVAGMASAFGSLPDPVKGVLSVLGGVVGVAALGAGAFLTLTPKILDSVQAFNTLAPAGSKAATAMGKVGKAAGAAGALAAVTLIFAKLAESDYMSKIDTGMGKVSNALAEVATNGPGAGSALDELFKDRDGGDLINTVDSLDSAIKRTFNKDAGQTFNDWGEGLINGMTGVEGSSQILEGSFKRLDTGLAELVSGGNAEDAAKTFEQIKKVADEQGVSVEDLAAKFPEYADALKAAEAASKTAAAEGKNLDGALTDVGAAAEASAEQTEEIEKALEDVGLAADGTVADLSKFTDALVNAGLLNLSARDAARGFEEAMVGLTESIAANGRTLDITTAAGRANEAALDAIAGAGFRSTQAMAANGASQADLQYSLERTHSGLKAAAEQFGLTDEEANTLARDIMKIPPGVDIKSWMSDEAKRMAEATTGALNAIDGRVVKTHIQNLIETINKTVTQSEYRDDPSMVALDPGGRAIGGKILGYSNGGQLPSSGPGTGVTDGFLGVSSAGVPVARLDANEWIINGRSSQRYDRELAAINAGTFPKLPGYANGGREYSAQSFAQSASSPVNVSAPAVTVMIGNEQLDSRMYRVASSAISTADSNTRYMRGGK